MGCDIHVIVERCNKNTETWFLTKHEITGSENRNYQFFNALAGVRGNGPAEPKGLPYNASLGTKAEIADWGLDCHSTSYMDLDKFLNLYTTHVYDLEAIADIKIRAPNISEQENMLIREYTDPRRYLARWSMQWKPNETDYIKSNHKYRVIFFFDN